MYRCMISIKNPAIESPIAMSNSLDQDWVTKAIGNARAK